MIFYEIFANYSAQIGPKVKNVQNLLKFGWIFISNMLISILMSKRLFIKYLPPGRDPNLSQNWKCPECIKTWNIRYFKYADLSFNVKNNFYEIFTTFLAQSVSKIKNPQKLLKFETVDI